MGKTHRLAGTLSNLEQEGLIKTKQDNIYYSCNSTFYGRAIKKVKRY
jgi:hypothetical protein